jgi:hypothetical protein
MLAEAAAAQLRRSPACKVPKLTGLTLKKAKLKRTKVSVVFSRGR